jgi:hypothetical protein
MSHLYGRGHGRGHTLAAVFSMVALSVAAMGIAPSTVSAQDVKRPVLGEHEFLQSPIFRGPFVQTTMRTRLGLGQALDIENLPPIEIDTFELGGKRGNLNFALLNLGYTHEITERFGLEAQFGFTGRLGDAVNTILSEGATMDVSFDLAAKYQLYEGETTLLTAGASLRRDDFTVIDFGLWVESLLEGEEVPLVTKRPSTRLGLDAIGAWAPVHWLGLQAIAGFSRGKNLEFQQDTDWYSSVGLSADFDLLSVSSVPIGFVLGGRRDTFPRALNDLAKATYGSLFRIAYTGRRDFVVALDFTADRLPLREGDTLEAGSVQFSTQYYF